jgi:hypothetical protein
MHVPFSYFFKVDAPNLGAVKDTTAGVVEGHLPRRRFALGDGVQAQGHEPRRQCPVQVHVAAVVVNFASPHVRGIEAKLHSPLTELYR